MVSVPSLGEELFCSVWDKASVDAVASSTRIGKIGSPCLCDLDLCAYARQKFDVLLLSSGMSTEEQIKTCVSACRPDVILHTTSCYPVHRTF